MIHIFQNSLSAWKIHLTILSNKKVDALAKVGRSKPQSKLNTMVTSGGEGGKEKEKWGGGGETAVTKH